MGRGPLVEGRSGSSRTAVTTLRAAVLAPGMDAGDDFGHHRRFAVVDLGLTGVKIVRIGEILRFSGEGSEFL
ncbi:hypothetical protein CDL15_Pgr017589 [Punica granatum]|uniref:Uncharacterized protein n=1 Tax=Punica granatum TaxID=22663 RepID=A0A218W726_PUNGR|nr:hypothetical protein CDL15_Pgr017589 [Punica granatum]